MVIAFFSLTKLSRRGKGWRAESEAGGRHELARVSDYVPKSALQQCEDGVRTGCGRRGDVVGEGWKGGGGAENGEDFYALGGGARRID
jgi:hypothetical protein